MIREARLGHLSSGRRRRSSKIRRQSWRALRSRRSATGIAIWSSAVLSPLRRLCQHFGANLIGENLLRAGFTPRQAITHLMNRTRIAVFTDQFINPANPNAHLEETGPRTGPSGNRGHPPAGTGHHSGHGRWVSGASFEGISRCLRDAFGAVSSSGCDIAANVSLPITARGLLQGPPAILTFGYINAVDQIAPDVAMEGQAAMARHIGFSRLTSE